MFLRLLLFVVLSAAPAFADAVPIERDMPYAEARAALVAAGWVPAPQDGGDAGRCAGRADICESYPEVVDCAGSGLAPCMFAFRHGTQRLTVVTIGETGPVVDSWRPE